MYNMAQIDLTHPHYYRQAHRLRLTSMGGESKGPSPKRPYSLLWLALVLLTALALLLPSNALASDGTDKAAHLGVSYAINTISYGLVKGAFRLDRTQALVVSAFTTLLVGAVKESMDRDFDAGDMGHNILGTALSVGTVLVFEF